MRSSGHADTGRRTSGGDEPVRPSTLFMLASISKTVIATAVMQGVERASFGLDDDVNDILPFAGANAGAPETGHHRQAAADAYVEHPRSVAGLGRPVRQGRLHDPPRHVPRGLPRARRRGLSTHELLRHEAGLEVPLLERRRGAGRVPRGSGQRCRLRRLVRDEHLPAARHGSRRMAPGRRARGRRRDAVSVVGRPTTATWLTASMAIPTIPTGPCARPPRRSRATSA